jgi:hypothetical protein
MIKKIVCDDREFECKADRDVSNAGLVYLKHKPIRTKYVSGEAMHGAWHMFDSMGFSEDTEYITIEYPCIVYIGPIAELAEGEV